MLIFKTGKLLEADGSAHLDTSNYSDAGDPFPGASNNTSLTDFTNPHSKIYGGERLSHFAVLNISQNGDDITADFIINYWQGTIDSNTNWTSANSPYCVGADLLVSSDVTLTIESGTTIKFASGTELKINGTLNAQGTSNNPITFTSASASPAAGDWDWIKFDGGSGNMEYCNIEYARFGLWFYGASTDPTVENCTMENCSYYGAYFLNNSAATFQYNTLTDNSLHGLLLIN